MPGARAYAMMNELGIVPDYGAKEEDRVVPCSNALGLVRRVVGGCKQEQSPRRRDTRQFIRRAPRHPAGACARRTH